MNEAMMIARIEELEAQVLRLSKRTFPEEHRAPDPALPDPLHDLLGEVDPIGSGSDRYLNARFDALTENRYCFPDFEEKRDAREEYLRCRGIYLPEFYTDPDTGEVIEKVTGEVVTKERRLRTIIDAERSSLKQMQRDGVTDLGDGSYTPIADSREKLHEAQVALAKLKGRPEPLRRDPSEALG